MTEQLNWTELNVCMCVCVYIYIYIYIYIKIYIFNEQKSSMTSLYIFYMKSHWCFLFTVMHSNKAIMDFPGGPANERGMSSIPGPIHMPWSNLAHALELPNLCSGVHTPQAKPLQWGAHTPKQRSSTENSNKQANKPSWATQRIWQKLLTISPEKVFINTQHVLHNSLSLIWDIQEESWQ